MAGYNVVVIVIDALRADHLGTYGYSRETSAFIDRLAGQGIVFDQASASSSFTRESISSLLTGLLPSRSGSTGWATAPAEGLDTLAEFFSRADYRTGFFSNTPVLRHPDFAQGFDVVEVSKGPWNRSGGGPELARRVAEFAIEHRSERFFAYAHFLDPHGPYKPNDAFYHRFAEERFQEPVSLYGEVRPQVAHLVEDGFGPGDPRFEDLMLRYDAEIAFVDSAIEEMYTALEKAGLSESTLIVITADHGEEFLEHGFVEHAWTLNREVLHVPLIFWAAGASPGRVATGVSLVDVLPSLLELNGIPYSAEALDGRTLFRLDGSAFIPDPEPRVRIAELLITDRNLVRAMIRGEWKYIAAYRWLTPAQRSTVVDSNGTEPAQIWGPPIREELYHVIDDPREQFNLAAEHGDLVSQFRSYMEAYRRSCADRPSDGGSRELSEEDKEILRSLGYL